MHKLKKNSFFVTTLLSFTLVTTTIMTIMINQEVFASGPFISIPDEVKPYVDPGGFVEQPGKIFNDPNQAAADFDADTKPQQQIVLEQLEKELDFLIGFDFFVPIFGKSIGGNMQLEGNALHLEDATPGLTFASINLLDPPSFSDYVIEKSETQDMLLILKQLLPEFFAYIEDGQTAIKELNSLYSSFTGKDLIDPAATDVKIKWTLRAILPVPEEIKNLNSIDLNSLDPTTVNAAELKQKLKEMTPIVTFTMGYCAPGLGGGGCTDAVYENNNFINVKL